MNQLSWLIYLADVAGSSGGWFAFFGWAFAIIMIIGMIIAWASCVDNLDEDDKKSMRNISGKLVGWGMPFAILFVMLSIITPSRETIYAIAASEVGEEVLRSPTMGKATRALEAWLDNQISGEDEAEPKETAS